MSITLVRDVKVKAHHSMTVSADQRSVENCNMRYVLAFYRVTDAMVVWRNGHGMGMERSFDFHMFGLRILTRCLLKTDVDEAKNL